MGCLPRTLQEVASYISTLPEDLRQAVATYQLQPCNGQEMAKWDAQVSDDQVGCTGK